MKTFYISVSLMSLCLVNGIIASINVQSVPNLCDQNGQETINMGGVVHYDVTTAVEDRSGKTVEETQRVLYDMYSQSFMEFDLTIDNTKTISGFVINQCEKDSTIQMKYEKVCQYIKNLTQEFCISTNEKCDERKPLVFKFKMKPIVGQKGYNTIVLFNEKELKDIKAKDKLWPDVWKHETGNRGGCAYSRIEFKMYCVINNENSNSVLYTRSLSDMSNDINWTQKEIPGTKGKVFTSLFYWLMTGKIRAQIITRDTLLRSAEIFDYVPTNEALFVKTAKNLKELWNCPEKKVKNNEYLMFSLMVITILVLSITVLIIFYFIFYFFIQKKDDPVFGLKRQ